MAAIKRILIVGGGTAGWLTAAMLSRLLGSAGGQGVQLTLVESPEIATVGVGEGTFPSIKGSLSLIGIDEARFMRASQGTFKQGIQFRHWVRPPGAAGAASYFHPFSLPSQRGDGPELLPYWLLGETEGRPAFAEAVTLQKSIVDAGRGPKRFNDADFQGPMNYAYHFDAARFAALLCEHSTATGVEHLRATVERVELAADGAIARVVTRERGALTADLYIDCTGFRAALIGSALKAPFRNMNSVLFNDRALAMQVPYERPDAPIAPYTIAAAQEAGWIWDIGLDARRGVGYVYSSRYSSDERAEAVLRAYVGRAGAGLEAKPIRLNVGYRETAWVKNCVSVGLAGGFVEPLESSGIGLIETAAYLIGYLLPHDGEMAPAARIYNELMTGRYQRIFDFIKMHYCLSQRSDSRYWIDNADAATIPDTLKDKLAMWRYRAPHRLDFVTDLEMYLPSSWQYVLYGMEYRSDLSASRARYPRAEQAQREFQTIRQLAPHAVADLPDHRALVKHIYRRALR
ncbi:MAG: tryptophan halogenase [Hydrocarboniphaga sp.]|uniref:tryptophan halogenase family protein n=1 Tax=Hydrocarboniphaga sp. TaxID=2033016 RepID=UPI002615AF4E|nr:tryptophan halogenase family protein [Hydrocarboniphaga sp.]MDB5972475.1 tryptophan halogenase [Hydrocarboniphaga sp.]